jgi:hypothetical protein
MFHGQLVRYHNHGAEAGRAPQDLKCVLLAWVSDPPAHHGIVTRNVLNKENWPSFPFVRHLNIDVLIGMSRDCVLSWLW